jgi:uroporphyrinogen decarboxylase
MGLGLHFVEGEGPKFERPLRDEKAIRALAGSRTSSGCATYSTPVALIRKSLHERVPLIGFSGSPVHARRATWSRAAAATTSAM